MSSFEEYPPTSGSRRVDGISCVGSLLLFGLMLFIMSTVVGAWRMKNGSDEQPAGAWPVMLTEAATSQSVVSINATELPLPTHTVVVTPTHTAVITPTDTATSAPTATATTTGTPTNTPTFTPTSTPTNTPTNTPTSTPTNTPTSTYTPTPTQTPVPLPTPLGPYSWTLKVPVLMYHYISVPPEDADKYRIDLSVEPAEFRAQMRYLAENGYSPIDLYDLSRAITGKQELPARPVVITIDDGYRDNYENAFPILREFGFSATIFVATEFIDLGNEAYLTWEMIEEMAAAGIRFEPHSKTHPDLTGQSRDYVIYQVLGSQETIAAHVGYSPRYFAYPSGRVDDGVVQILKELDFWGAVTTRSGKWHGFDDRYHWTRLRVRNDTPLAEFIDLVEPGDTLNGKPAADR